MSPLATSTSRRMRWAQRALEHCALPACSLAHPPPPCVPPQCTGAWPTEHTTQGGPGAQGRRAHPGACSAFASGSSVAPCPARAAPCPPRPRLASPTAPRQPLDPCTLSCALTPCSSMHVLRAQRRCIKIHAALTIAAAIIAGSMPALDPMPSGARLSPWSEWAQGPDPCCGVRRQRCSLQDRTCGSHCGRVRAI